MLFPVTHFDTNDITPEAARALEPGSTPVPVDSPEVLLLLCRSLQLAIIDDAISKWYKGLVGCAQWAANIVTLDYHVFIA